MAFLTLTCRLSLAAVFALSAGGKTLRKGAFAQFAESLRGLPLMPARRARPVAAVIVAAEAVASVTGLLPWTVLPGLLFAGLLLTTFTVAVSISVAKGGDVSCRCFGGATARPLGRRHVVRNLALTGVAAAGLPAAAAGPAASASLPEICLAAFIACVAALLVAAFDDLVDLVVTPPEKLTSPLPPR